MEQLSDESLPVPKTYREITFYTTLGMMRVNVTSELTLREIAVCLMSAYRTIQGYPAGWVPDPTPMTRWQKAKAWLRERVQ